MSASSVFVATLILSSGLRAQTFPGKTTGPSGATAPGGFIYDTGNGLGTIIGHGTAVNAGLGTVGADGKFTPSSSVVAIPIVANNGAYKLYCFGGVKVAVEDSNGKSCDFTGVVYVTQDNAGANRAVNTNILGADWINGVKACAAGAGVQTHAYWNPGWTPPAAVKSTAGSTDTKTGKIHKTLEAVTSGPTGMTQNVKYIYKNACAYSFIPEPVKNALGLQVVGSVDITNDLDTQAQLGLSDMNYTGQLVFDEVIVPAVDLGFGSPFTGKFLVSNAANSDFGIIGGSVINAHHLYANGVYQLGTQDMLAYCFGTATKYGVGCASNEGFTPDLGVDGCMSPGGTFTLHMEHGLGGSTALLMIGSAATSVSLGQGCSLLVSSVTLTVPFPLTGSGAGQGSFQYDMITPASLPAFDLYTQAAVIDPGAPLGYTVSNGVHVRVE